MGHQQHLLEELSFVTFLYSSPLTHSSCPPPICPEVIVVSYVCSNTHACPPHTHTRRGGYYSRHSLWVPNVRASLPFPWMMSPWQCISLWVKPFYVSKTYRQKRMVLWERAQICQQEWEWEWSGAKPFGEGFGDAHLREVRRPVGPLGNWCWE